MQKQEPETGRIQPEAATRQRRKRESTGLLLVVIIIVVSVASIIGSTGNIPFVGTSLPNWATMKVVTSVCFIFTGLALLILRSQKFPDLKIAVPRFVGVFILLIGFFTAVSYLVILRTGSEPAFNRLPVLNMFLNPDHRMAFITAILFVITGLVLITLSSGNFGISHVLIIPVIITGYFIIVSYFLGFTSVYAIEHTSVALYSGINFCLVGVSILLFYPKTWLMKVFVDDFAGGHMARRLIPGIMIVPLIIGWLRINAEKAGLFSMDTEVVLISVTYTFCFTVLLWIAARRVINIDKRSQKRLRESEMILDTFFSNTPMGMIIYTDDNRYVRLNRLAAEQYGLPLHDAIGKTIFDVLPADLAKATQERNREVLKTNKLAVNEYNAMLPLRSENATMSHWQGFRFPVPLPGGKRGVGLVTLNITDRINAELERLAALERLQAMFTNAAIGIVEGDENGFLLNANARACEILGYSREELPGKHVSEITVPEDRPVSKSINDKIYSGEIDWINYEKQYLRKDGSRVWVDITVSAIRDEKGKLRQTIGTIADVSERKQSEQALIRSETILKQAETMANLGAWVIELSQSEDPDKNPLIWSDQVYRIFGYEPGAVEVTNDLFFSHVHPDDRQKVSEAISDSINSRKAYNIEHRIKRADGIERIVVEHAEIRYDDVGMPNQIIGAVQDITEQKHAELELKQKNEELTRFIYTVSHDLKSPLVTIKAFTSYLEEDIESGDKVAQGKDFGYISNAADKMGRLLDELLELSRIGRKEQLKSEVTLETIAQAAIDLVAGRISQRNVKTRITGPPVVMYGYGQRLIQLYQNLLDNAVKFMGDQPDPLIEIGSYVDDNKHRVVLFVRDNGSGIDPQYHHKVFGLFEKFDSSTEGTGIGLALIKRIVEVHNGSIWFTSEGKGKGTTFYFTLEKTRLVEA
ncbi:MAG TPA: PAS domain S-box protein [Bacteroidales bacterium]|nr:PAS domain S-box protein [Bacteroidales bacterium]